MVQSWVSYKVKITDYYYSSANPGSLMKAGADQSDQFVAKVFGDLPGDWLRSFPSKNLKLIPDFHFCWRQLGLALLL